MLWQLRNFAPPCVGVGDTATAPERCLCISHATIQLQPLPARPLPCFRFLPAQPPTVQLRSHTLPHCAAQPAPATLLCFAAVAFLPQCRQLAFPDTVLRLLPRSRPCAQGGDDSDDDSEEDEAEELRKAVAAMQAAKRARETPEVIVISSDSDDSRDAMAPPPAKRRATSPAPAPPPPSQPAAPAAAPPPALIVRSASAPPILPIRPLPAARAPSTSPQQQAHQPAVSPPLQHATSTALQTAAQAAALMHHQQQQQQPAPLGTAGSEGVSGPAGAPGVACGGGVGAAGAGGSSPSLLAGTRIRLRYGGVTTNIGGGSPRSVQPQQPQQPQQQQQQPQQAGEVPPTHPIVDGQQPVQGKQHAVQQRPQPQQLPPLVMAAPSMPVVPGLPHASMHLMHMQQPMYTYAAMGAPAGHAHPTGTTILGGGQGLYQQQSHHHPLVPVAAPAPGQAGMLQAASLQRVSNAHLTTRTINGRAVEVIEIDLE